MLDAIVRKFIDRYLGLFFEVENENVLFSPASGELKISKAQIKSDVFASLDVPITVKCGFVHSLELKIPPAGLVFGLPVIGSSEVLLEISDVLIVLVPQMNEAERLKVSIENRKRRLIELAIKLSEVFMFQKSSKVEEGDDDVNQDEVELSRDASAGGGSDGFIKSIKWRLLNDLKLRVLGRLEVKISNVHLRYEDGAERVTGGLQIGKLIVSSQVDKAQMRIDGRWQPRLRHHLPIARDNLPLIGTATGMEDIEQSNFEEPKTHLCQNVSLDNVRVYCNVSVNPDRDFFSVHLETSSDSICQYNRLWRLFRSKLACEMWRIGLTKTLANLRI